jgi:hypothetical protein
MKIIANHTGDLKENEADIIPYACERGFEIRSGIETSFHTHCTNTYKNIILNSVTVSINLRTNIRKKYSSVHVQKNTFFKNFYSSSCASK